MKCEACDKDAVACTSEWLNDEAMKVLYWCAEHAPEDAEFFARKEVQKMNNIKLLKAQSKLALSAVDERLKIGIQRYIEALEAEVAELEGKVRRAIGNTCPVCFGDKYLFYNDGLMHPCPSCNGSGKDEE